LEHKSTIEAIKKPGIKTKDAAAMIAADHIAEEKDYYEKLDTAKLEKGGPIEAQDLSKGTTLQGPSHAKGGVEIQVNGKPVAEAKGGEIVVNKNSSKLFCEEISEINQAGGGKKLDCDKPCDTCDHTMEKGGHIELPINGDEFENEEDEMDFMEDGGQIDERVAQALRDKERTKEFKDTDIVSYTRKYSAAYDLVTSGDLDKIEQDNVTAYKLIEKSKVWEPYNIESLKEEGNSSGAAYLKVKAREALSARPLDSKDARRVYVENIEALKLKLQSAKRTNEVKDILYEFANLRTFNFGIIPDNIKVARYGETRERKYFEEIFGKKFYNFCKVASDSAQKIVVEAFLYEDFSPELRQMAVGKVQTERKIRIDKANKILDQIKDISDENEIKAIVRSIDENYYNKYDKDTVIAHYTKQNELNQKMYDEAEQNLPKSFAVRENDWSWTNPKDKSETTKEEAEAKEPVSIFEKYGIEDWRKSTKRLPLDFIKRTGGLEVDKIAVDKVTSKFGYRNVIFGNYVNDKERKESLNHFLGAMLDLHEIMNMDIQELNKLGGLDINFGSTGCGAFSAAMACYMPQLKAINLTKKKGDGCIAHEWSHYLDNVLGEGTERKATKQIYATQFNTYLKGSEKIKLAFLEYLKWLNEGGEDRTILVEFNPTKKYRYQLYGDTAEKAVEAIQKQRNYYAQYKNATDKNVLRYFGYIAYKLNGNKPIVVPMKTTQCSYMVQSAAYGGPDYWTNPKELFARSFEWFIENELKKQNRSSTYLVDTTKSLGDLYYLIPFDQHPYPRTKSDEEFLTNWFKKLFSIIRSEYSIAPFNWDTNTRVDEFLDYSEEQKKDLINTGVKVLSTGKIVVEGDDIELAENGYAFKRNIIENKQVYTVLLNNQSINTYLSKINDKDWSVFTQDDAGKNYIFDSFDKLEDAKEYVLKNKLQKQEIGAIDKIVAAIPAKDFQEMKQNSGIPEFKQQQTMPKIQPILNEPSDKYYLLMDYYVNNRIDFTKLPIEIHEQLDELLDLTTSYADKDGWEGILPDSKKADNAIDKLSDYPHKIIRALWSDIQFKTTVYENLIEPGIKLYDTIMEQYPGAIVSDYEKAANYSLFDDFADTSDKTDLRNIDFPQFLKQNIASDVKIKATVMVLDNPSNYSETEVQDAKNQLYSVEKQFQTIIRGAINEMYYDKKITECVLSYSRVREIIISANLEVPKHYKLLSETSCANRKSKAKNSNKLKIDSLAAKIADEKAKTEKQKADAEAQKKELKALKQKTKQSVKSVRSETETSEAKAKKIKLAKAKASSQQQRIRIILMATPENLVNKLKFRFSKTIDEFGITEIFVRDGEVNITSKYDVPPDHVEAIEKFIKTEMK
jgi:hypothetical protein